MCAASRRELATYYSANPESGSVPDFRKLIVSSAGESDHSKWVSAEDLN